MMLSNKLEQLYQNLDPICEQNVKCPDFVYPSTKTPFEVGNQVSVTFNTNTCFEDILIRNLSIGFEYQGKQHYASGLFANVSERVRKDSEKKEVLRNLGITLITVPYWSNLSLSLYRVSYFDKFLIDAAYLPLQQKNGQICHRDPHLRISQLLQKALKMRLHQSSCQQWYILRELIQPIGN